jgi:hypothetical protein
VAGWKSGARKISNYLSIDPNNMISKIVNAWRIRFPAYTLQSYNNDRRR